MGGADPTVGANKPKTVPRSPIQFQSFVLKVYHLCTFGMTTLLVCLPRIRRESGKRKASRSTCDSIVFHPRDKSAPTTLT